MAIVTEADFKTYIDDPETNALNAVVLATAQEIVEGYLGYPLEEAVIEGEVTTYVIPSYTFSETVSASYFVMKAPIHEITSIELDGVAITGYKIIHNYIEFLTRQCGVLEIEYSGGYDPVPETIKTAIKQIATLELLKTGKKLAVQSSSLPNGVNYSYIPYTDYSKYLKSISRYKVL